ncbi:hypothetical protein LCGC14_2109070, partial [marine sediment metagenome]
SRDDPVWWIKNYLGARLWEMQRRVARAVVDTKRTAVASCHGAGKSFISARIVLHFLYNRSPSIVITAAPTARQVEKILWKEIRVAHKRAIRPLGGEVLVKQLKLDDDWYAFGFASSDYDADKWQGFHEKNILIVVDEAAGVARPVFDGIEGALSAGYARLLLIGNPTNPNGGFHDAFNDPRCAKFYISAFDTPNFTTFGITLPDIKSGRWRDKIDGPLPAPWLVTPEWVEERLIAWGEDSPLFIAKVLGQFPEDDQNALIALALVVAAQEREIEKSIPHALGLDVARQGDDDTICYERRGCVSRSLFESSKESTMQTTGRAVKALKDTGADIIHVDGVGIGAGVVDRLNELEKPVSEINFGSAPVKQKKDAKGNKSTEEFANLKAQLYWNIRRRYEEGQMDIDPDDDELAAQATSVKWGLDSKGRIAIESKQKMKARGEKSPDAFEAQVYSFADDVLRAKARSRGRIAPGALDIGLGVDTPFAGQG